MRLGPVRLWLNPFRSAATTINDLSKDPRCFTEIGTGVLPIQDRLDAASKLPKLDYMFLEQDHTALPEIESIRRSHDAFSAKFTGISWP